jgi:U5 small nuclear ribonucleoprotein component
MAEMYSYTYHTSKEILEKLFWGNFYFNKSTRKFMKTATKEYTKRTFVEFILEPIYKIFSHAVSKEKEELSSFLAKLGVLIKSTDYR